MCSIFVNVHVGGAFRSRVTKRLCHQFRCPADAEKHFEDLRQQPSVALPMGAPSTNTSSLSLERKESFLPVVLADTSATGISDCVPSCEPAMTQYARLSLESRARVCSEVLQSLTVREKLDILARVFSEVSQHNVPADFLHLASSGMQNLRNAGRMNAVYLLAKAVGTMREDGSDTLLPTKRMPMGSFEYMVAFFTTSSKNKVSTCSCTMIIINFISLSTRLSIMVADAICSLWLQMVSSILRANVEC